MDRAETARLAVCGAGEIVEAPEWRTDVPQMRRAERRIALRPRPRVIATLGRLEGELTTRVRLGLVNAERAA